MSNEIKTPETMTFICSICGEASTDICVRCTKDACPNHRCEKCNRCSDCCQCDFRRHH
jgi:hypothetical protein